jgi:hypothetical protein
MASTHPIHNEDSDDNGDHDVHDLEVYVPVVCALVVCAPDYLVCYPEVLHQVYPACLDGAHFPVYSVYLVFVRYQALLVCQAFRYWV